MKKKSKIKTVLIASILIIILGAATSFALVKTGERNRQTTVDKKTKTKIVTETKGMDVKHIINYSLNLTADMLHFSKHNNIKEGRANCVGYASLCSSICNTAFDANGIDGKAKPVVGYIESYGVDLCKAAQSICTDQASKNFVKDHDFVECITRDKVYQFDPCLYDILGVSCYSEQLRK